MFGFRGMEDEGKILSYFEIEKLNTTVKREVLAGFTTFISMAYILFVNPTVLGASEWMKEQCLLRLH